MKKIALTALALMLLLSACGNGKWPAVPTAGSAPTPTPTMAPAEERTYNQDFGTYTVPAGWVESVIYSSEDKFFYMKAGTEGEEEPNNISINAGTNRYSLEEHEQFRDAILRQLLYQVQGMEANLTGDGYFTEADIMVYKFQITHEDSDVITTQYYLVNNYSYVLVHETTFSEPEETDTVAEAIVESFRWPED